MKTVTISLLLTVLFSLQSTAQVNDQLSINGQVRHRTEFDAKDFNADTDDIWFHLLRTRIGLKAMISEDVNAYVQIQDARVWGSENPTLGRGTLDGNAPALDFHQAYFKVKNFFNTNLDLKVGRQELAYGNERLVGSVGWSNTGRTFDAGLLAYSGEKASVDVFAARLVGSTNVATSQNFYGIYGVFKPTEGHAIDAFVLVDDNTEEITSGADKGEAMLTRFTGGIYAHGKQEPLFYNLEGAYQGGTLAPSSSAAQQTIKAYMASAEVGITLSSPGKPQISGLATLLSGDDNAADDEAKSFNTLFATNHKFYGFMDFFPATLPQLGLQDFAISASATPIGALKVRFDVHHFMLSEPFTNGNEELKTLGQEFDFVSSYKYNDHFTLEAGASAFTPGEVMEIVRGEDMAFWFYLMTAVTF